MFSEIQNQLYSLIFMPTDSLGGLQQFCEPQLLFTNIILPCLSYIPNLFALLQFPLFAMCRGEVYESAVFLDFHQQYFQEFPKSLPPSSLYTHRRLKENIILALHILLLLLAFKRRIIFSVHTFCKLMLKLFFGLPYCAFTFNLPNFVILSSLLISTQL